MYILFTKQKRKNYFIFFITVIIIVSMLSACGKSASTAEKVSSTKETSNETTKSTTIKEPTTMEEISLYDGPNRDQRLVEAAKKEGSLQLYTSIPQQDIKKIADEFKNKYGINVEIWRSSAVNILQKIVTEAKAGKSQFDVVSMSAVDIEALSNEKLLQKVNSPYINKLIEQAVPTHKEWMPLFFNIFVQMYNTKAVKKEELPRTYQDLLDPKWKDRLGIEATNFEWFATLVQHMGEEKGLQFFKDLMKNNSVSVRQGNSVLAEMTSTGEVPFAITVFSYKARQLKASGAPIDWFALEPTIARTTGIAVSKKAQHPNSAVLFFDYMLNEGQKALAEIYYDPANKDFQPPEKLKLQFINDQNMMDENAKWVKLYDDVVVKRVK